MTGHETRCQLPRHQDRNHWWIYWIPIHPWTLNFPNNFSRKVSTDSTSILLKYFQFPIYHFAEQITNCAIQLCSNWFRAYKISLYCHITAQMQLLFFHPTSRFNTEIYKKKFQILRDSHSILGHLSGLFPGPHFGLPYPKPHDLAC